MARQTIGMKAERVLRFLLGLRHPRATAALAGYGFDEATFREGWQLLGNLSRLRLGAQPPGPKDATILGELDAFENRWFRVAHVSLDRHFPDVSEALFLNLSQSSGDRVALTVRTFLERLSEMAAGAGAFARNGPEARRLLETRGLGQDVASAARDLVDALAAVADAPPVVEPGPDERLLEDALWKWYLEWSGIARVAITDGRVLRQLGFARNRKHDELGPPGLEPPSPAPAASSTPVLQ